MKNIQQQMNLLAISTTKKAKEMAIAIESLVVRSILKAMSLKRVEMAGVVHSRTSDQSQTGVEQWGWYGVWEIAGTTGTDVN